MILFFAIVVVIMFILFKMREKRKMQKKEQEDLQKQQEFNRTMILDRAPAMNEDRTTFMWEKEGISGRVSLTEVSGEGSMYRKTVESAIIIGKEKAVCDVCIPNDNTVSRIHCRISRRGNEFFIEDQDSSNGTFVNGRRVMKKPMELVEGDVIKMGRTRLVFHILD